MPEISGRSCSTAIARLSKIAAVCFRRMKRPKPGRSNNVDAEIFQQAVTEQKEEN